MVGQNPIEDPPLSARQRAVANYCPPKIGVVEPQPMSKQKKPPSMKPLSASARASSRQTARATMRSSDPPAGGRNQVLVRANGNNVLVTDPPPLPVTLPPTAPGFHDNRNPTETIIALMQGIQSGLTIQAPSDHYNPYLAAPPPAPISAPLGMQGPSSLYQHDVPMPMGYGFDFPVARQPLPPPPTPPVILPPPPQAPTLMIPTLQEALMAVMNPPPPVQPVVKTEPDISSVPSSSSGSHSSRIPSNLKFLQYLIAGTTFNQPYAAPPAWMTLPQPSENDVPFNLTPQQIQFEAMRTGMLMNHHNPGYSFNEPNPGYSYGPPLAPKLADLFGYSGAHSWVPGQPLPTLSQSAVENLKKFRFPVTVSKNSTLFNNHYGSSSANETSSSTTSFVRPTLAQISPMKASYRPRTTTTPSKPATPASTRPRAPPTVRKLSSMDLKPKSSLKRTSDKYGKKSRGVCPTIKKHKKVSWGDQKDTKNWFKKPKRELSASPPPTSSTSTLPRRQSMRVAIRNSLEEEKFEFFSDDSDWYEEE